MLDEHSVPEPGAGKNEGHDGRSAVEDAPVGAASGELASLEPTLMSPPSDGLPKEVDLAEWTELLRLCGVRDGALKRSGWSLSARVMAARYTGAVPPRAGESSTSGSTFPDSARPTSRPPDRGRSTARS